MKTSKKILSVVLALVMLTTMVTSAFYASACNSNNHDPYKEAATVLDLIDNKLDAYDVDLAGTLDGILNSKELIAKGNEFLSEDNLNSLLSEQDFMKYLESGKWLVELGDEKIAEILGEYLSVSKLDDQLKGTIKAALESAIENLPEIAYLEALLDLPTVSELDKMIDDAIGDYLDGEKLIAMLDKLAADAIEGKLVYDENGRKILKALDGDIAAKLDPMIENAIGKYVNDGTGLITLGDEKIMELLGDLKVFDVPVMQLRYINVLDRLVQNIVLSDGSDIMVTAANALKGMFPNVQPNYESIVSCLIPILSAFDFGAIMANTSNIGAALGLASPMAFAYLAGIDDPLLEENYLDKINQTLAAKGYSGNDVVPLISLTPEQQTNLMAYVTMEKAGTSLADIAEAGFNWTDFTGNANKLDIANAFVKIALGDANKLGDLAADPNIGPALVRLLCDLFNDLQSAPVTTILKKLSDAEGLNAIFAFARTILNGDDTTFKSYDLYKASIRYDGKGNTCFYVDFDEHGDSFYIGPKENEALMPVVYAAIDFLSNISDVINSNGGDLLKSLLVDKLPQLGNLLKSLISYTDDKGNEKVGFIAYLLDDYKPFLQSQNAILCDAILVSIAEASIEKTQQKIEEKQAEIGIWQNYLTAAHQAEDDARLAKAKELGVLDDSVTAYDEATVNAAIEAKIAALSNEISALEQTIAQDEADLAQAEQDVQDAQDAYDAYAAKIDAMIDNEAFIDDICLAITDPAEIQTLRDDCEEWFNSLFGAGKFNQLAQLILDKGADFYDVDEDEVLFDDFFEGVILGEDGLNLVEKLNQLDDALSIISDSETGAVAVAQAKLDTDTKAKNKKVTELEKYESGAIKSDIVAAGDGEDGEGVKIHINDNVLDIEGDFNATQISETITTINNVDIAALNGNIAAEEAKILEYNNDSAENQAKVDAYDTEGLALEQTAFKNLVNALVVFLGGDKAVSGASSTEEIKSLYQYFEDGQPIEMLLAPDRVTALKNVIDQVITLFGDKIGSGADYTTKLWDIEDKLFGSKGILSTLYDDFKEEPVLAITSRIKPIAEIVDIVYEMGFLQEMIDQYKPLINAVADIFGDENEGFIANWKKAYEDGSANHHYVNAVLSLLPKIVAIYDQVKDMDAVKELIAPYSDLIDLVLGLLSKDFYDDIINDGVVETLLEDENLKTLRDTIIKVLDMIEMENKEQIKALVNEVFDKLLDGLYQDLLTDPVIALAKRINTIADMVGPVTAMFGVDISAYQPLIDDLKKVFDDSFAEDWQQSIVTALVNRIAPLADLLSDALDVVKSLPEDTVNSLLDNIPEDIRSKLPENVIDVASALLKNLLAGLKELSTDLIKDYSKSPITAVAKRVPTIVDMINALIADEDLVNLALDLTKDIAIGEDGTKLGDFESIIRRVIADFKDSIGPILKDVINEDTINTYNEDKLAGALKLAGGALELVKAVAADSELIDGVLALDVVKNIKLGEGEDALTVADIADAIKAVAAMLPEILDGIDLGQLLENVTEKPVETVVELAGVLADAIDQVLASDDAFINRYTEPLRNTLELVRDLLNSLSIKGDKLIISFVDEKKPLESVLSVKNVKKVESAINEVADFIDSLSNEMGDTTDGLRALAKALKKLEGIADKMKKQSLLKSVEDLGDFITEAKPLLEALGDMEIGDAKLSDFYDVLDAALEILDDIGTDADKNLVGAVLSRIPDIGNLIKAVFENKTICDIQIGDYKIGDFKDAADILVKILDKDFYEDYKENPIRTIFDRIDYVKALYEWVKDSGLLDSLDLKIFGYDILEAVDILLPILDKDLYYDFEQSLFKAITSSARIGRIEKALKDIIRFADLFSYSVNEGLCSAIGGVCGVLDGLYDGLVLPTTPAHGGNQLHSTSRVIIRKLPAIQNLIRSLGPLFGEGKLFNLTDVVSDTVKMEKDDILKMIEGVDLVKPYYYGISDVLDVVGENAAKYNWNTIAGMINALNGVGVELVPALEKALGVSGVEWKDLKVPTPEYAPGGVAERYLAELSGELGECILTQLVGTLLKAALTIPAIKDMIGEVGPEEVAGLLNDLLEFDFKDNEVEFDAFNTEHLIYTGINLLLPKTAPSPSPATADEVVMIVAAIGTTAAASTGIFFALKKRREEMGVNA